MNQKKSYFERRSVGEMRGMNVKTAGFAKNLVQMIDELNPDIDVLEIRTPIIPQRFRRRHRGVIPTWAEADRKCYKHGDLLLLEQPKTLYEALESKDMPLDLRRKTYEKLYGMKQQEIEYIGISFRPIQGRNRLRRVMRFREVSEGQALFTYAENYSIYAEDGIEKFGIKVELYADAERVRREGATAIVHVPSRTQKAGKYRFGIAHIPTIPNLPQKGMNENLASVLSLTPVVIRETVDSEDLGEPIRGRSAFQDYQIRFTYPDSQEESDIVWLDAQDVAGYLGVLKKQLVDNHNQTPLQFNPYPLPSRKKALFYYKLNNNVLMFDPTKETPKHKLRGLYIGEQSILLCRATAVFGNDAADFWDPTRDGIFKSYLNIWRN